MLSIRDNSKKRDLSVLSRHVLSTFFFLYLVICARRFPVNDTYTFAGGMSDSNRDKTHLYSNEVLIYFKRKSLESERVKCEGNETMIFMLLVKTNRYLFLHDQKRKFSTR